MAHQEEMKLRGEPRICAWDIETTKLPLQFPNAEYDQVKPPPPTHTHMEPSFWAAAWGARAAGTLPAAPRSASVSACRDRGGTSRASLRGTLCPLACVTPALGTWVQRAARLPAPVSPPHVPATCVQVFMISYMIDKQGYLITNREVRCRCKRGTRADMSSPAAQPAAQQLTRQARRAHALTACAAHPG